MSDIQNAFKLAAERLKTRDGRAGIGNQLMKLAPDAGANPRWEGYGLDNSNELKNILDKYTRYEIEHPELIARALNSRKSNIEHIDSLEKGLSENDKSSLIQSMREYSAHREPKSYREEHGVPWWADDLLDVNSNKDLVTQFKDGMMKKPMQDVRDLAPNYSVDVLDGVTNDVDNTLEGNRMDRVRAGTEKPKSVEDLIALSKHYKNKSGW